MSTSSDPVSISHLVLILAEFLRLPEKLSFGTRLAEQPVTNIYEAQLERNFPHLTSRAGRPLSSGVGRPLSHDFDCIWSAYR